MLLYLMVCKAGMENHIIKMQQKQLPIGYYLKLADSCLTKGIDEIQSQYGLNRVEWQILNAISENPGISKTELFELMKPIAGHQPAEAVLTRFIIENRLAVENDLLTLTAEGKALHSSCFDMQKEFRKKAVAGIPDADYQATISTLKKLIANIS